MNKWAFVFLSLFFISFCKSVEVDQEEGTEYEKPFCPCAHKRKEVILVAGESLSAKLKLEQAVESGF